MNSDPTPPHDEIQFLAAYPDVCVECGAIRKAGVRDAEEFAQRRTEAALKPRKVAKPRSVRRGLIPKGRVKAKRT